MPKLSELDAGELHVWIASVEPVVEPFRSQYLRLLTEDERQRHARYYFEKNRDEYLLTRALERDVLSTYLGADPRDLRFERTSEGKPQLAFPRSNLWFNLSNTRDLVACIVGRVSELGVDVEHVKSRETHPGVARRFFAAAEVQELESRSESEQPRRFFEYWTLKESYLKARGLGLAYPLDAFWFTIRSGGAEIQFAASADDSSNGWQFFHFRPTAEHQLAVGARSPKKLVLCAFRTVPFSGNVESVPGAI